jgi:hypothetical protein
VAGREKETGPGVLKQSAGNVVRFRLSVIYFAG